ncbi:hypothetical protein DFH11DRAFT_882908 [Phellopilus nigrolimitatus]|nr:hypothetical protein DFH11DRAFT_882908 [Phellopilus nigrolimitatus]
MTSVLLFVRLYISSLTCPLVLCYCSRLHAFMPSNSNLTPSFKVPELSSTLMPFRDAITRQYSSGAFSRISSHQSIAFFPRRSFRSQESILHLYIIYNNEICSFLFLALCAAPSLPMTFRGGHAFFLTPSVRLGHPDYRNRNHLALQPNYAGPPLLGIIYMDL